MPITNGGNVTNAAGAGQIKQKTLAAVALGVVTAIMAAFTDNGKFHRFFNKTNLLTLPDGATAVKVTAAFGGTAADIKAVQVIVIGTDVADAPLTESLPAATVNTAGSVTSLGSFKTITSIEIPAHDGTGATTSIGIDGHGASDILAAFTDVGVNAVFKTATIVNPVVPRNITGTAGGTAGDVKAITPVVRGTNEQGAAVSETLPAFTVNTTGDVLGSKAFATVTEIDLPAHDGTGATTSFGTGAKLGLGRHQPRDTILRAYLADVKEATAPTVVADNDEVEKNTFQLASALNASDVTIYYIDDQGTN